MYFLGIPLEGWLALGVFIGILFRFLVPYYRKYKAGEITEWDNRYLYEAIAAFLSALGMSFPLVISQTIPPLWVIALLVGFVFGLGNGDLINEVMNLLYAYKSSKEEES